MRTVLILTFLCLTLGANAQVVINEICPANADINHDPTFFDFSGWVELYNKGASSVSLGNYYLSDDPAFKNKWKLPSGSSIPARGYLLIWCDERNSGTHSNFNIDPDGGELILSNATQTIDQISFPKQYINISYGRTTDGGETFGHLVLATPGKVNDATTGVIRLQKPVMSVKSGRYSSGQTISFQSGLEGTTIRYTIDGSEPDFSSLEFSQPIVVSKTTTIKAKAFKDGFIPSETSVETFFINEHAFSLPVISLSTKPAFLFDNRIGIYVEGTNGISGNCTNTPLNWNQDWDRHAVFEYFDKSGARILDQNIDIRIGGACSRNNPQKSLVVKARDKYGSKTIENRFFSSKEISEFGGVMLRNAGNDFWNAMFRDAFMQSLPVGQMDVDYMAYQPAIVYLNGAYWGIQNIREKIDGDYIESNFGIDKSDVDLLETGGIAIEGSADHYNRYLDSLNRIDRTSPEAFEFINRYIDVQEFVNYLSAEIYYCNTDWPGNNVKFWRQKSSNGKFRWILWDLDFGFGLYQNQSWATHPTLEFATDPDNTGWPNPAWSTLHLRLLLQNPQFKAKFLQTLTTSLSTTFNPQRVVQTINTFQNNIKLEMPFHTTRWQLTVDGWNNEVERLRQFAYARNEYMKTHISSFFGESGNVNVNINSFPQNSGGVKFNGILNDNAENIFYFRDLEFAAEAVPNPGYKFSHYKVTKRESTPMPLIDKGSVWKYYDQGAAAFGWNSEVFNDSFWAEGPAELGYGDGDETTTVGFGPGPEKFITTYFRKTFNVADTVKFSALSGRVLFDDGIVIYLNGEEVYRYNLPQGPIDNNTLATNQDLETTFFDFTIPKGKIKPGDNVLAVEVHQNNASSSDISFNLELATVRAGAETEYESANIMLNDIADSDIQIAAYFVPVVASSGLLINEVSAQNSINEDEYGEKDDWIEIYNNGTDPVDITNYFFTDKLNNKTKSRIKQGKPEETIINPGAYKLIWADGDVNQGPLHLNFKLSTDGEEVGFYQMIGSTIQKIDEVTFDIQPSNSTFSRIPNVTGNFTSTSRATPLAENIFEVIIGVEQESVPDDIHLFPNPTSASVRLEWNGSVIDYQLVNASGRVVASGKGVSPGIEISLRNEPAGLYLVVLQQGNKRITRRIVKR